MINLTKISLYKILIMGMKSQLILKSNLKNISNRKYNNKLHTSKMNKV